jgi:hypothetical protein
MNAEIKEENEPYYVKAIQHSRGILYPEFYRKIIEITLNESTNGVKARLSMSSIVNPFNKGDEDRSLTWVRFVQNYWNFIDADISDEQLRRLYSPSLLRKNMMASGFRLIVFIGIIGVFGYGPFSILTN